MCSSYQWSLSAPYFPPFSLIISYLHQRRQCYFRISELFNLVHYFMVRGDFLLKPIASYACNEFFTQSELYTIQGHSMVDLLTCFEGFCLIAKWSIPPHIFRTGFCSIVFVLFFFGDWRIYHRSTSDSWTRRSYVSGWPVMFFWYVLSNVQFLCWLLLFANSSSFIGVCWALDFASLYEIWVPLSTNLHCHFVLLSSKEKKMYNLFNCDVHLSRSDL